MCKIFNVSTARILFFIIICLANNESNIVYNDLRQIIKCSIFSEVRWLHIASVQIPKKIIIYKNYNNNISVKNNITKY